MDTTKQRFFAPGRPVVRGIVLRFGFAVLAATAIVAFLTVAYYVLRCRAMGSEVQLYKVVPSESQEYVRVPLTSVVLPPLITAAGVVALAAGVAAFFFSYRIASAIFRLEREMDEVGRGNLSRVVRLKGNDEMREVAEHFSAMTARLSEDVRAMREEANNLAQTAEALSRETAAAPATPQPVANLARALRQVSLRLRDRLDQFTLR